MHMIRKLGKSKKAGDFAMLLPTVSAIILTILILVIFYVLFDLLITSKAQNISDVSEITDHLKLVTLLRTPVEVNGEVMALGDVIAIAEDDPSLEANLKRELYNAVVAAPEGMFGPIRIDYSKDKSIMIGKDSTTLNDAIIYAARQSGLFGTYVIQVQLGAANLVPAVRDEFTQARKSVSANTMIAKVTSSTVIPTMSGSDAVVYLIQYTDKRRNNLKFSDAIKYVSKGEKIASPEGVTYVYWGNNCPCNGDRQGCWSIDGEPCFAVKDENGKVVCEEDLVIEGEDQEDPMLAMSSQGLTACEEYFVPDAEFKKGIRPAYLGVIDEAALETDPADCDLIDPLTKSGCCIIPQPGQAKYFFATDGDYPFSRSVEKHIGSCVYHPGIEKKLVYWGSYGLTGTHQENNHYWCELDACKKVNSVNRQGALGTVSAIAGGIGSTITQAITKAPAYVQPSLFSGEGQCFDTRPGEEYFIDDAFIEENCYTVSYLLRLSE